MISSPRPSTDQRQRWIFRPRPNPAATLRVFCFPYAGLGASVFRTWAQEFPSNVELCLMQPPGREGRWLEKAFVDVRALAESASDALTELMSLPFVFYGHSLGALTSFEVARALRRRRLPLPLHLFVAAHRAPQLSNPHPALRQLPDRDFIAEISRQFDGIPQAVLDNPDLVELMLPCLRADFTAFETYSYPAAEPLACPISAFGGRMDRRVSESELTPWRDQTTERCTVRMFDGNHFFLQDSRDALLATIRQELGALTAAAAR
jgi:surfactin synthase thioesterase subunit